MPLTATIEDIKAYQTKVEKDKITSEGLAPCPRCEQKPEFFKIHAYRERRFLFIVKMLVKSIFCSLVRFRCTDCGTTFTLYPGFAMPHKHYIRQTIESLSNSYNMNNQKTYEKAAMTDDGTPGYAGSDRVLAASTIHRWITTLANLISCCCQDISKTSLHKNSAPLHCNNPAQLAIPKKKYKTTARKLCLARCSCYFTRNLCLKNGLSPSSQ